MTTPFIVSGKQKIPLSNKNITNPDLPGTWRHVGSGRHFLIDTDALYYIIDGPNPYTASATTLDLNGWVFDRLYGTGSTIIGVWLEPDTGEEVTFRTDGSFNWYDPNAIVTFGTYQTSSAPDMLTMAEARAHLSELGNQLVFDAIFSGSYTYDFVVDQTDLVLTDPNTGETISYKRV